MEKILNQINNEVLIQNKEINNKKKSQMNTYSLKEFYRQRNETVYLSRLIIENETKTYRKKILNPENKIYSEIIRERDINEDIYMYLIANGFSLDEIGTIYLKKLIRLIYDEETFHKLIGKDEFNYWNLDDYNNIHYKLLGTNSKKAITEMTKVINSNQNIENENISTITLKALNILTRKECPIARTKAK